MVTYTFVYIKDGEEVRSTHVFDSEPDLQATLDQMATYEPDEIIDYIRED